MLARQSWLYIVLQHHSLLSHRLHGTLLIFAYSADCSPFVQIDVGNVGRVDF